MMPTISTCDICGKPKHVIVTVRIRGDNTSEIASIILCREHHKLFGEKQNGLLSEFGLDKINVKR